LLGQLGGNPTHLCSVVCQRNQAFLGWLSWSLFPRLAPNLIHHHGFPLPVNPTRKTSRSSWANPAPQSPKLHKGPSLERCLGLRPPTLSQGSGLAAASAPGKMPDRMFNHMEVFQRKDGSVVCRPDPRTRDGSPERGLRRQSTARPMVVSLQQDQWIFAWKLHLEGRSSRWCIL
jgi:hypothetical protein